jgi:hypothetical protein
VVDALRYELGSVYGQTVELGTEIDDYLAEYRYNELEQTIESVSALIAGAGVGAVLVAAEVCPLLQIVLDGENWLPVRQVAPVAPDPASGSGGPAPGERLDRR